MREPNGTTNPVSESTKILACVLIIGLMSSTEWCIKEPTMIRMRRYRVWVSTLFCRLFWVLFFPPSLWFLLNCATLTHNGVTPMNSIIQVHPFHNLTRVRLCIEPGESSEGEKLRVSSSIGYSALVVLMLATSFLTMEHVRKIFLSQLQHPTILSSPLAPSDWIV